MPASQTVIQAACTVSNQAVIDLHRPALNPAGLLETPKAEICSMFSQFIKSTERVSALLYDEMYNKHIAVSGF